jgi:hypothetical protein
VELLMLAPLLFTVFRMANQPLAGPMRPGFGIISGAVC